MISIRNLTVRAGNTIIVEDTSFDVTRGSCTVLLGPNGSGKTTVLRAIGGLIPYEGTVTINGSDLRVTTRRRQAELRAFAEQEPAFPAAMTVLQFVKLGCTPLTNNNRAGNNRASATELAIEASRQCDIAELLDRPLASLSGGERRRASIAQAIVQNTPVVLLDEPTTALDIAHQQSTLDLVDELRHRNGTTFVIALHDLVMAGHYASHVVLLRNGRLAGQGPATDILRLDTLQEHYQASLSQFEDGGVHVIVPSRPGGSHRTTAI